MRAFLNATSSDAGQSSRTWRDAVPRPPWTDEATVRSACTSCGDCIQACPEGILFQGPAGTPTLSFTAGECTFCGACADACAEAVFTDTTEVPWTLVAHLSSACLLVSGVSCRSCTDMCDAHALRFDLRAGAVGRVGVDTQSCTGCGACVAGCPVGAITISENTQREVSA